MSSSNSSSKKDVYALKKQAMKYYEENNVPRQMEIALNLMFYEQPSNIYGFLVNFFSRLSQPAKLNKISATPVLDSNGQLTIQTDVYCTVNNLRKHICSSVIPRADIRLHLEDQEKAAIQIQTSIEAAINIINLKLNRKFAGKDPSEQKLIDSEILAYINLEKEKEQIELACEVEPCENIQTSSSVIEKHPTPPLKGKTGRGTLASITVPNRPSETFTVGCEMIAAVSQAVCVCAAASRNIPIYQHVAKLAQQKGPYNEIRIPIPMVTIMQSGKSVSGKVTCIKEFMIVPGTNIPVDKSVEYIQNIYQHVSKSMVKKQGPLAKLVNETGALCPQLDTVSQGLDILLESINAQNLTPGQDMYLAINCAGYECFDQVKGKYEIVTGQFKNPEDMPEFWADIIHKYPYIVAIIDPVRSEDSEQWLNLCGKISEGVFVIGDYVLERPGILRHMDSPIQASGIVVHIERMNTISDIIACANKYQDRKIEMVVSTNHGDTTDTFIVDFAVGLNALFLKVGGPCRGERISKLNRLIQIYKEIKMKEEVSSNSEAASNLSAETSRSKKSEYSTDQLIEKEEIFNLKPYTAFAFPHITKTPAVTEPEIGKVTTLVIE